jgi:hypothetical protein
MGPDMSTYLENVVQRRENGEEHSGSCQHPTTKELMLLQARIHEVKTGKAEEMGIGPFVQATTVAA